MEKVIEIQNISYRYDKRKTAGVCDLSFDIYKAECLCLLGPSGSGKTTTAKIIGEVLHPQKGRIVYHHNFSMSYVPQHTELPNQKTVFQFLWDEFTTEIADEKKENLIRSTLLMLNISNEIHSPLNEISGGQRQRVIIAKALIQSPTLIVLDEPFGHLDERLRFELMHELFKLFKDKQIACLWVTHETREALAFSDRLLMLNHGMLQQIGTPFDLYHRPNNLFCAEFFGQNNTIAAKLISHTDNELVVSLLNREIIIPRPEHFIAKEHQDVLCIFRPEHIQIHPDGPYQGKVKSTYFQGPLQLVEVAIKNGGQLWLYHSGKTQLVINSKINITIDYHNIYCLDEI
jgi:ABC-type Fe3+/spermidine/putrescine transport system ATPase subunit